VNIILKNYTKCTNQEHHDLLEIRNSPNVLKWTRTQKSISLEEHLAWVSTLSDDHTKRYYLIKADEKIQGGINIFDIKDHEAYWGIFLNEGNPVLSSIVTYHFLNYVFERFSLSVIHLEVHEDNTNAYNFDKRFGFLESPSRKKTPSLHHMSLSKSRWLTIRDSGLLGIIKVQAKKHSFRTEGDTDGY
jgi:UDP-4-amino-4,6-dideoxy-N-acetyl-beta-L-altrosamine N-acetyltransferase